MMTQNNPWSERNRYQAVLSLFLLVLLILAASSPLWISNSGGMKGAEGKSAVSIYDSAQSYSGIVHEAARKHGLDPRLIYAIIDSESAGNAAAISPKGAKGLMQLMPVICLQYNVMDPFNAKENISAGTAHLAYLLSRLNGNLDHALAAYNSGLMTVLRFNGIPPFTETKDFVRRVVKYYLFETTQQPQPPGKNRDIG